MALALAKRLDTTLSSTRDELLPVVNMAYKRRCLRALDPDRAWLDASDTARDEARQKLRFVHEIDALRKRGWTRPQACAAVSSHPEWFLQIIQRGTQLNLANYDQWTKQLNEGHGKPQALLRAYKRGAAKRQLDSEWYPEFAEILCRQFFHYNGLDLTVSYRNACIKAREMDLHEIPSEPQARRYMKRVLSERVQIMLRDPKKYRDQLSGYLMLHWNAEPGAVWIGDHRVLDIFVRVPVYNEDGTIKEWIPMRPWCTAWMDAKSGYLVSCCIYADRYPNSAKILEALYIGIRKNGNVPPWRLITDNGKDYLKQGAIRDVLLQTSKEPTRGKNGRKTLVEETFEDVVGFEGQEYRHSVARALGCVHQTTAPYKGRQKPIERIFRNFARQFDKLFYGYCGNKPSTRPEEMRDFRGNVMRLLTIEELIEQFRIWLAEGYHKAGTKSLRTEGKTPQELWDRRRPFRTPMTDEELDWAFLVPHREPLEVRAGPGGSNVWYGGWPYEGVTDVDHITVGDFHGKQLLVKTSWSPILPDVTYGKQVLPARIWLFSLDGEFLAEAQPAMRRDVFGGTAEQNERISETCRKVAVLRKADREAKEALAGVMRIFAPAHDLGMQRMTGPTPAAELPPHDGDTAAVTGSRARGTLRGRLGGDSAPQEAAPIEDRDEARSTDTFRRLLRREEDQTEQDAPKRISWADRMARFEEWSDKGGTSA